jgi:DNA-binding transcriptional LysR family regulator
MELHQIRAFVTVARLGNVTKAAEVLCLTQPAVTAQIKGLESSLGVALFDRGGGRMSLTRAGEMLQAQASVVLSAAGELKGAARSMQGELSGRIEVGLPGETTDFLRTGALSSAVQSDLPLVELHTRTKPVGQLLDLTRAGALTGSFLIGTNPPRDLQWQSLRSISYRIAYPTRLAAEMERGGWRVLAGLPWVSGVVESHIHQMLRSLFEKQGLEPNVVMRCEDTSTLESFVRAGTACALLRQEIAVPGVERQEWCVWGHARVDAQLFFGISHDLTGDPLAVALLSAVQTAWMT